MLELVEQAEEPADVGVIERRVHFVHEAERAWLGQVDREEERHRDERSLARGKQVNPLRPLATRSSVNLDLRFERIVGIAQPEFALAAPKERLEYVDEVCADRRERFLEEAACGSVDLLDRLQE